MLDNFLMDLKLVQSELVLLGGGLILLLMTLFPKRSKEFFPLFSVGIILMAFAVLFIPSGSWNSVDGMQGFFASLEASPLSQSFRGYFLALAAFVLLVGGSITIEKEKTAPEGYSLILFSITGGALLLSANDFFVAFVALEMMSLSLYAYVAFWSDGANAKEAAMKYFITGAVSSSFFLMGVAFIYGLTGACQFDEIANLMKLESETFLSSPLWYLGIGFLLAGLGFKMALAPFHLWVPDVYQGASTQSLLLIGVLPKLATLGFSILLLKGPFSLVYEELGVAITFLAVLSMGWGALGALTQRNFRRLMGYSAVANMGFVAIGLLPGDEISLASMNYLLIYSIGFVAVIGLVAYLQNQGLSLETVDDFVYVRQVPEAYRLLLALLMFSLAGVPPLAGFFGKFVVFKHALQHGYTFAVFAGIFVSVVSAAYYLRIIKALYFDALPEGTEGLVAETPLRQSFLVYRLSNLASVGLAAITILFAFVLSFL